VLPGRPDWAGAFIDYQEGWMRTKDLRLGRLAAATVCAALAGSGALAAQASAATLTLDKACYVNTASGPAAMTIAGAGFTPGDSIEVSGGTTFATATADPTGAFSVPAQAPELTNPNPGTLSTTLTATDETTGQTVVAVKAMSTNLAVLTKPGSIPAREIKKKKITFTFSGFTPGKEIWGFYLRKKVVAKAKFGKAAGPCGTLTHKALLYPGGHPTKDQYNVAFESTSRYVKKAFPSVVGKLSILSF
jgi:hypothetical protein